MHKGRKEDKDHHHREQQVLLEPEVHKDLLHKDLQVRLVHKEPKVLRDHHHKVHKDLQVHKEHKGHLLKGA